ncbi:MAG: hypothetical protein BM556_02205 [Bacteriovorax sp. MedPE-SWde]|nr:MAG: hypothetical protein BM556_02205 [Bacteriovorax sp. MedPE-SWde]
MNQDINSYIRLKFKEKVKATLKKTLSLSFNDILSKCLQESSISETEITCSLELENWFNYIFFTNYIEDLPYDEYLQEIIIHSESNIDLISKGEKSKLEVDFLSSEDLQLSFEVLARKNQAEWNFQTPFASFSILIGGSTYRCTLVHECITQEKNSKAFFRKASQQSFDLESFSLSSKEVKLIQDLVRQKKNIIVSGATASGKTTFLKSLVCLFDKQEHTIVIEDTHEIPGPSSSFSHLLANGSKGKTMTDYCSYAMRMSPDRILLGEIRSNEVIPFVLAMNTGHKGLLTTIHSNSAKDTISRLSMLFSLFSTASNAINYQQVTKLICTNIDYVIHLEKKNVIEIINIIGADDNGAIYKTIKGSSLKIPLQHPLDLAS